MNPTQRWVNNSCEPCPQCPGGEGLDEACGWGVGATASCQVCLQGETYSKETTSSRECANCTSCETQLHRVTVSQCSIYTDSKCGSCQDEWVILTSYHLPQQLPHYKDHFKARQYYHLNNFLTFRKQTSRIPMCNSNVLQVICVLQCLYHIIHRLPIATWGLDQPPVNP